MMTAHDKAWELLKMNISSDLMEKNAPAPSYHQEKNRGIENLANTPRKFDYEYVPPDPRMARLGDSANERAKKEGQMLHDSRQENIYGNQLFNLGNASSREEFSTYPHEEFTSYGLDAATAGPLNTSDVRDQFGNLSGQGVVQDTAYGNRVVEKVPRPIEDSSYNVGPEGRVQTGEPMDLAFRLLKSLNPEVEDTPEEEDEEDDGMTDAEMDEWMKELEIERREWEISQRSDDPTSPHFYEEGYDEYGHPTDPTDPSNQDDDPDDFLDNYGLRKSNYVGKMNDMPSMPSMPSMSSPPSGPLNGKNKNGNEEYSHKDLDAESLIDFLVQTLQMDYQDAKTLATHHKTKELASASQRKARAAASEMTDEGPPMSEMG